MEQKHIFVIAGESSGDQHAANYIKEHKKLNTNLTNKEISNNLGTRSSFTDVAKTIAEYFNIENKIDGTSFLYELNNVQ